MREVRGVLVAGFVRGGIVTAAVAPPSIRAREFDCRIARLEPERAAYFALRRSIFCAEQGLFIDDDRDTWDDDAYPIVCVERAPGADARGQVVGVVRIWEEAPGEWWGGRLGVERSCRSEGAIGRRLVQTAVGTARAWGATRFRATVQLANVAFFRRLRWRTLEEMELLGQPHHLMEASLDAYPLVHEARVERERATRRSDAGGLDAGAATVTLTMLGRDAA
jgi:putative N-acetyltransferase (TIGR04045 family)